MWAPSHHSFVRVTQKQVLSLALKVLEPLVNTDVDTYRRMLILLRLLLYGTATAADYNWGFELHYKK